ncbi:hypothetical protein MRX96_052056, partial [Rhipicephalus microplus]
SQSSRLIVYGWLYLVPSFKPIVRLGRRGVAARIRSDTDPLGLHSAITDRETATRTRRRPSPATEDHGPTLEELIQRKTEARRQERLSEQRQLEIARYSPWGKGVGNPSPNQNFRRRSRERTIAEEAHSTVHGRLNVP